MSSSPVLGNPLPVDRSAFSSAGLLLVVDRIEKGTAAVVLRGVIDVDGGSGLRAGDSVALEWPYDLPQDLAHRNLVVPVQKTDHGSYRALSAGLAERDAVRLLAGLPADDRIATAEQTAELVAQADAIGAYSWVVDPDSDGRKVEAMLRAAYQGAPPEQLVLTAPTTDQPGGSWTFFDGADRGARYGIVFLAKKPDGSWRSIGDLMPWNVDARYLVAPPGA